MSHPKHARPDHAIHDHLRTRWSPYGFSSRAVETDDLRSIFEGARWAASSYNEQPWRYIVATRDDEAAFADLLSCLVEANQAWARHAPVLALGVAVTRFARNDRDNRAAFHDLGLASASLTFEATARGLAVHQMIGILPDRARTLYHVPDDAEPLTALAIGHPADPATLSDALRQRDETPRQRRPLRETVFTGDWGRAASFLDRSS